MRRRRRGTPKRKMPAKNAPLLAASQPAPRPGIDDGGLSAPERLCDAVVLTVSVEVPEAFATEAGVNEQAGAGVPPPVTAQVSATVPVNPPVGATVIVDLDMDDVPWTTEAGVSAVAEIVKPGVDTVRLTVVLWTVDPPVPVTVKVEDPVGVFELVVTVRVEVPVAVSDPCTKAQLAPTGKPEQVRVTVLLKPFSIETVTVEVPACPGPETVTGVAAIEKSGVTENPGQLVASTLALTDPRPVTRS